MIYDDIDEIVAKYANSDEILKCGWLKKRPVSTSIGKERERYFILKGDQLDYYADECYHSGNLQNQLKGSLSFLPSSVVTIDKGQGSKSVTISNLRFNDRGASMQLHKLSVGAKSVTEMNIWIHCFEIAISVAKEKCKNLSGM